jgi:hypothetical protein
MADYHGRFDEEERSLLLIKAHNYDTNSELQRLPKDIISHLVALEQHERRILTRSHYRICFEIDPNYLPKTPEWSLSLTSYEPSAFSPNLIATSKAVINFLHAVRKLPNDDASIQRAIELYFLFLILQNNFQEELVPSLEIQSVWFTHMLQSCPYESNMSYLFPRVYELPHPLTKSLFPSSIIEKQARTQSLMEERYGPSLEIPNDQKALWESFSKWVTPKMVRDDRDWILEFRKFTYGTDIESRQFLEKAHVGYQKFLFLKSKHGATIEDMSFSPCPTIDLFWHSHLLHPSSYQWDTDVLLGHSPKHKLLNVIERTRVWMQKRDDKQLDLWQTEFGESMFDYAVA